MIRGFDWNGRHVSAMLVRDMQVFDTPFLRESLRLFNSWKRFEVLPNGGGFAQERNTVIQILSILSNEDDAWDSWERAKDSEKQ